MTMGRETKTLTWVGWALALVCVLIIIVAFWQGMAQAQSVDGKRCDKHEAMLATLAAKYKEAPRAIGIIVPPGKPPVILELLTAESGTFTILVTNAEGLSCMLAAGGDFEEIPDHLRKLDPKT
jgi:hypothetical protein